MLFEAGSSALGHFITKGFQNVDDPLQALFSKDGDYENHLNVNFDDGFSNEGCGEEGSERNSEMSACDACQIEERIGNRSTGKDSSKSVFFHIVIYDNLGFFH